MVKVYSNTHPLLVEILHIFKVRILHIAKWKVLDWDLRIQFYFLQVLNLLKMRVGSACFVCMLLFRLLTVAKTGASEAMWCLNSKPLPNLK